MADTPRRPRRWLRRLLLAGLAGAGLVAAGPWLVSKSPLPQMAAREALKDVRGSVQVGGASFTWLADQEVTGVELRDTAGRPVLTAPRVTVTKSLVGLLMDRSDLGTVRVERGELRVVCDGETTNLEDALANLLRPSAQPTPAGPTPAVRLECVAARLVVVDAGKEWVVEPVDLTADVPGDPAKPVTVSLHAALPGARPGKLDADATLARDGSSGTAKVHAEHLPIAAAGPGIRRVEKAARLDGDLSADLDAKWDAAGWGATASANVAGLDVAGPWLADERVRLANVSAAFQGTSAGGKVTIAKAEATTDVARASVAGTVEPAAGLDGLMRAEVKLSASADLAALAKLLPKTLRLREGLEVTAGRLTLDAHAEPKADGPHWSAALRAEGLAAVHDGRPLSWPQPLSVDLAAHKPASAALPVVDRLSVASEGVKLEASGTADRLTASADCDLGRLREHAGRFIDLGTLRLAGTATARLTAGRGPNDAVNVSADLSAKGLRYAGPTGVEWAEPACAAKLDAAGTARDAITLATASATLSAGGDEARAELLAPMVLSASSTASARVKLTGELSRWRGRLAPWVDLVGLDPAGVVDVAAKVSGSLAGVSADECRLSARDFRFHGYGLTVAEPTLTASAASAKVDLGTFRIDLVRPELVCPTATARFATLAITGEGLTGAGDVSADLGRAQRLVMTPTAKGADRVSGTAAGKVDLAASPSGQGLSADLTCTNTAIGDPAAPMWLEPTSRAVAKGRFAPDWDAVALEAFVLESPGMAANGSGTVAKLATRQELNLAGDLRYDWSKLGPKMRAYLGTVEVSGAGAKPFRVSGTTAAPLVDVGAGWETVKGYGCQVGRADVSANLRGDWLRVAPIDTTVNGGKARFQPSMNLAAGEVVLGAERIDHAKLTPAACAELIGYAAPLLANVAEAEGDFSVGIDAGRLPMADPTKGDIAGRLTLHAARVSGSPLVREIAAVLRVPPGVAVTKDSEVPFRLVNGRVHHQNLTLEIGGTVVRTSGSVGVDGSLGLIVEFPMPAHIVGGKIGEALAKQTVKLPVGGTLARPRLDDSALRALAGQAAQAAKEAAAKAAEDALRKEAEKQLQRLIPGKKP